MENTDLTTNGIIYKAALISADTGEFDAESSIKELEELAQTAGVETSFILYKSVRHMTAPPV